MQSRHVDMLRSQTHIFCQYFRSRVSEYPETIISPHILHKPLLRLSIFPSTWACFLFAGLAATICRMSHNYSLWTPLITGLLLYGLYCRTTSAQAYQPYWPSDTETATSSDHQRGEGGPFACLIPLLKASHSIYVLQVRFGNSPCLVGLK